MPRTVREMMLVFDGKLASGLRNAATDAAKRLNQVNDTIKRLDAAKVDINKFRKLKESALSNEKAFAAAQKEVGKLAGQMRAADNPSRTLTSRFEKAKTEAAKLKDKLAADQSQLERLRRSLDAAGVSTVNLATDTKGLQVRLDAARREADALRRSSAQMSALQQSISKNRSATSEARGQLFDAAGMAVVAALPVKKAMEFQSVMADVRKVVDGLDNPKLFDAMSKSIINLTTKGRIPMAADQLAQIVAAGGQAGIARRDLTEFARDAAKMGVAFDVTAEEAGTFMANWRTAFQIGQEQVRVLADQINYLGNTTAASAPKISEVVTRIGPLGKVGGLASGTIAALAASMVGMGTDPDRAATGIKKLITTLNAGTAVTKEQSKAFDKLGIDTVALSKRMQKDAGGAILDVFQKIKRLPKYEQTAVLKKLFGEEALAAVGALLPALDDVAKNLGKVGDQSRYAGSMQKEFDSRSKTAANSLQLLQNAMVAGAIKAGSVLLPELVKISEKIGPIIDKVVDWADKNPKLFGTLVKVATALVGLRIAMLAGRYAMLVFKGGALDLIMNLVKVAKFLRLGAAAQWLLNVAMTANPIGLIIAGIAALGVGIYMLIKHWASVKKAMIAAWQWFLRFATEGPGRFIPIIGIIGQVAKNWDKVKAALTKVWEVLKKVWDIANKLGGKAITAVVRTVSGDKPAKVAKHARGGIVSHPTLSWIGEQGPEAVIPLSNNRSRARSLLNQVNLQLGMAGAGGTNTTVSFAPVINISGNADRAMVESALGKARDDFRRMFEDLMQDTRRRSMS